jgi:four helix bundle protein
MTFYFDHERLEVYQEAIAFVAWWEEIRSRCVGIPTVTDQMDRASTSMPLNIAEGNAKYSMRDRSRYVQIACGSALECASCLDVIVARKRLTVSDVEPGKRRLRSIVSMLIALINSLAHRVSEEAATFEYQATVSGGDGHSGQG